VSTRLSVQSDIRQHHAATHPGQVHVLGIDLWNGSALQLAQAPQ